jgi:hypothetical protein
MSLSPIEIAKAFNAPLFEGFRSNSEAKKILKEAGGLEVVYGEVVVPGREGETKVFRWRTRNLLSGQGLNLLMMGDCSGFRDPCQ